MRHSKSQLRRLSHGDPDQLVARIAELEARNGRLEEALRQIAETNYTLGSFETLAKGIARAALSTKEDGI